MKNALLLLLFLVFSSGCGNPYTIYYTDLTGGENTLEKPDIVIPSADPRLIESCNIEKDNRSMMEDGYFLLGFSSFSGWIAPKWTALQHARKIHADTVVVYKKYIDTISGSIPVTIPDTQTSFHSGSMYGFGGASTSFSGTSTTYGTKTEHIPYTFDRYADYASFWVKRKFVGLGIYCDDLTDDLRRQIGSNKGVHVVVVVKGSPAFNNDVLVGDIIRKVNDIEVLDKFHFANIAKNNSGQQIKLEIFRTGKTITKEIQVNMTQRE